MTSNNFLCTLHTHVLWSHLYNCIHIHHLICCMFQFDCPSNYYSHCILYILKVVTNVRYHMSLVAHWFGRVKYWIFVIFRQAQLKNFKTNIRHYAKLQNFQQNGLVCPDSLKLTTFFYLFYTWYRSIFVKTCDGLEGARLKAWHNKAFLSARSSLLV